MDTVVLVRRYVTAPAQVERLPASAQQTEVAWEDTLLLHGYEPPGELTPGHPWPIVFYWSKLRPEANRYVLSLRLVDDRGQTWAQLDQPLWDLYPPARWPTGATIRHAHEEMLPAGLPPGPYQLWLRVVDGTDDQPLTASNRQVDVLLMPKVVVQSAPEAQEAAQLPSHEPRCAEWNREIELVGSHLRAGQHRPGHLIYLDLYWRARERPRADYRLRLQLIDETGRAFGQAVTTPTRPDYPPTRWQPGELLHGKVELLVPPQTEGGHYPLRLALIHPETDEPLPARAGWWPFEREAVALGEVHVVEWPLVTQVPPLQRPLRADFGQPPLVELHGYDLSADRAAPGERLSLTLYWRARARMETSYTVFVHLAGADERIVGQGDGAPKHGLRLTTSWRAGEVIVDPHAITIDADAPPGGYRLWAGLFDPATDARLPAAVDGAPQPHDRVLLGTVQIEP
jgi:hypothetical protein